ncbi:hypothetical protein NDU88_004007 [Pleurodeles waltl]|uniref:Uncharacterized protein n=1 Tax=Pleurodeles waltl TaxID=8319 RepID=A0AAV7W3Q9_PLEWA|nr:hypothetical protein NDU88_004007 [Pleurodeles waltl]
MSQRCRCACRRSEAQGFGRLCLSRKGRHPAGDSGTGSVPRWSSVGCAEVQQGFPSGGIQAESAQARFLGGIPRNLVAQQRAQNRQPGRRL